ncbi:unannotated protein [freshwater metagenome]|uniref:Unannotated protein n=1 Tax=freshwater metagenome TaxID=449393 RepID=A0A6J7N590_9ZZZZ
MILAAAAANRVLLELAQPGGGLAGIADRCLRAPDGIGPCPRERCDASEVAEHVQRWPLRAQELMGEPGHREEHIAGLDAIAIADPEGDVEIIVAAHRHEHCRRNRDAGGDTGAAGDEIEGRALTRRHGSHRGDVDAAIEILLDRSEHQ